MRISFVVPQGALILGIVGPFTVFSWANKFLGQGDAYEMEIISRDKNKNIVTSFGLRLIADGSIEDVAKPSDTLFVAAPLDAGAILLDRDLISWVAKRAPLVRRYASVCSGAIILAAAGLLNGKRATAHSDAIKVLAEKFPSVKIETDRLHVRDGNVWTSAGMTAGIDLALAMVEEDHGKEVAQKVAREILVTTERDDSVPHKITRMARQVTDVTPIEKVQMWVVDHIAEDLSVKKLAEIASMSVRNFTRVFQAETGISPARFVDAVRVDAARRMLETTRHPLKKIAIDCGFIGITRMRRAFYRHVGISPQEYRLKLHAGQSEPSNLKSGSGN